MDIYTSLEEAARLIHERWQDTKLRQAIKKELKDDVPDIVRDGPSGMIWRQIGTPDGEFKRFIELNEKAKLKPMCFEYVEDKFVAGNMTKYNLAYPPFSRGLNKSSKHIVVREKIIHFSKAEGKRMSTLKTLWGENLVDFEHSFMLSMFPIMKGRVVDISEWLQRKGKKPALYYESVMSLALAHFIYFDDFDILEEEGFTQKIVMPSFEKVQKRFGIKPLIVKISKHDEYKKDPYWWCYSKEAKAIVDARRKTYS